MQLTCDINHAYKTAPRYFPSLQSAVVEMVQNAYRSYWPIDPKAEQKPIIRLDFFYNDTQGHCIRVTDYGCGIESPERLLSLNTRKWADDVAGDQDPAGLGAIAPLAHAKQVEWASTFGALVVDSHDFFNSAEYRESLLPTPASDEPRAGGAVTRVTMRGCDRAEWRTLQGQAHRVFALYRLVTVVVDGKIPGFPVTSEFPVVEAPGLRVHVRKRGSAYHELWHGRYADHIPDWGRNIVLWHGHAINLGPDVFANLPDSTTLPSGLTYSRQAVSFAVEVLEENLVTPLLPDRLVLRRDDRTLATIQRAYRLALEAYDAHLVNLVAHPPMSVKDFSDELRDMRTGVENWGTYVAQNCAYKLFEYNAYNSKWSGFTAEKAVCPRVGTKTYALDEVVLRTPSGDEVYDLDCQDNPGSLMFGSDTDWQTDILKDAGFYLTSSAPSHVLVLAFSEKFPNGDEPAVIKGLGRVYMVPAAMCEDSVPTDIEEFLLYDDMEGSVCTARLDNSSLISEVLAFGPGASVKWMVERYSAIVQEEYESRRDDRDCDPVADFDTATARIVAKWENKSYIDLALDELRYKFNATDKKLTIDFAAKTVEVDGKVMPVTWK
jgi:anti-sigma regulatory factor (Ser/Thr protein kinase)